MTDYCIIQPSTFEDVLASVCYMAYWNDTALRRAGHHVEFHEDASYKTACDVLAQWKDGPVLIDVSSPPQVELALALWRRFGSTHDLHAIGYKPYADLMRVRYYGLERAGTTLIDGAHNYIYDWDRYSHAYATIDSHIKCPGDDRMFVPAFWGIGCGRGCEYCYINRTHYPYGFIEQKAGERLIDYMVERGWNVHFEDENFYLHPNAVDFIRHLRSKKDTKWVCHTDSLRLTRVIDELGVGTLLDSGHWLSEVGLETSDPAVLKKRQDIARILQVQNRNASNVQDGAINVLWLAVTLLPDETIGSMNRNGRFYAQHGLAYERLLPRLQTQSSEGGCGQFFVPYPGTKFWSRTQAEGTWLREPLLRLRPSWLGNKLGNDIPVVAAQPTALQLGQWVSLYSNAPEAMAAQVLERCDGVRTVKEVIEGDPESLAVLCCLSRLQCIVPATTEESKLRLEVVG